jgi:uncharacterized membrane protein (UPF0127 family)
MAALRNQTRDALVTDRITVVTNFFQRAIGLLGRSGLAHGEGIWLQPCGAIHTLGMRFSLDVVFLDRDDRVVQIARNIAPNRLVLRCAKATSVIEFAGGFLDESTMTIHDRLERTAS